MIRLFNRLSSMAPATTYSRLLVAPEFLRKSIYHLIDREIAHRKNGKEARVRIKCNSITDPAVITKLYEASHSGVAIDLFVRGICCLRPGLPGISENITVTSIVGRFLEHSRVLWFLNDGESEMFVGSADLMGRNLDRRVENFFPILDANHRAWLEKYVFNALDADTVKKRILRTDGSWARATSEDGKAEYNAQEAVLQALTRRMEDFSRPTPKLITPDESSRHLNRLVKAATKHKNFF